MSKPRPAPEDFATWEEWQQADEEWGATQALHVPLRFRPWVIGIALGVVATIVFVLLLIWAGATIGEPVEEVTATDVTCDDSAIGYYACTGSFEIRTDYGCLSDDGDQFRSLTDVSGPSARVSVHPAYGDDTCSIDAYELWAAESHPPPRGRLYPFLIAGIFVFWIVGIPVLMWPYARWSRHRSRRRWAEARQGLR